MSSNDRALLQFPAALHALRARKGMSQKALSITAQVDQSHLCGVEKNRSAPPSTAVVDRLSKALELDGPQQINFSATAVHDRILHAAHSAQPGLDLRLVSAGIQAAMTLCQEEREGVVSYMFDVVRSKRVLTMATVGRCAEEPKMK